MAYVIASFSADIAPILVIILGGGLLTAWINFRKLPAEREGIVVTTLTGGVQTLDTVITRIETENTKLLDKMNAQDSTIKEYAEPHRQVRV